MRTIGFLLGISGRLLLATILQITDVEILFVSIDMNSGKSQSVV